MTVVDVHDSRWGGGEDGREGERASRYMRFRVLACPVTRTTYDSVPLAELLAD